MDYVVFVAEFGCGRGGGFRLGENGIAAAPGVGIEHKELAGVSASVAQKLEAVGFGAGKSLFVAKNDSGGVILELAGADETTASEAIVGARHRVFLRVAIKVRSGILHDDVVADPVVQVGGRAGVDV